MSDIRRKSGKSATGAENAPTIHADSSPEAGRGCKMIAQMKLETLSLTGEVIASGEFQFSPDELPLDAIEIELKCSDSFPSIGSIVAIDDDEYVCLSVSKIQWLPFFESFGRVIIARPV